MNLRAPLSQLLGTCPKDNWLAVDTLEGCAGSWGGEPKSSEQISIFFQVL